MILPSTWTSKALDGPPAGETLGPVLGRQNITLVKLFRSTSLNTKRIRRSLIRSAWTTRPSNADHGFTAVKHSISGIAKEGNDSQRCESYPCARASTVCESSRFSSTRHQQQPGNQITQRQHFEYFFHEALNPNLNAGAFCFCWRARFLNYVHFPLWMRFKSNDRLAASSEHSPPDKRPQTFYPHKSWGFGQRQLDLLSIG